MMKNMKQLRCVDWARSGAPAWAAALLGLLAVAGMLLALSALPGSARAGYDAQPGARSSGEMQAITTTVATATPTSTLAADIPAIAPDNLEQVQELNRWGLGAVVQAQQVGGRLVVRTPFELVIYNPATQKPVFSLPEAGSAVYSPDGKLLLTTYPMSTTVNIWKLEDGTRLVRLDHPQQLPAYQPPGFSEQDFFQVRTIVYAPDGKTAAVAYGDNRVLLYSTADWKVIQELSDKLAPAAHQIAFSDDGQYLATSGNVLAWWRLADGKLIYRLPNAGRISSRPFSPDGKRFVTSDRGVIFTWSIPSGRLVNELRTLNFGDVAYSPDGKALIIGGTEVRDASTGRRLPADQAAALLPQATEQPALEIGWLEDLGHYNGLEGVTIEALQQILAYGVQAGRAFWWEVEPTDVQTSTLAGEALNRLTADWSGGQFAICLEEGLQLFATPGADARAAGRCRTSGALAFAPDGKTLARASGTIVTLATLPQGEDVHNLLGHTYLVAGVAYAADGRLIATSSRSGREGAEVFLWRTQPLSLYQKYQVAATPGEALRLLAFSPDGRWLAAGGADFRVHLLRAVDGSPLPTLRVAEKATSLAFSPDGGVLAAGDATGQIYLRSVLKPAQSTILTGHRGAVMGLVFTADGKGLVSTAQDGTVRLWGIK
jgi:WD40 repeat protein